MYKTIWESEEEGMLSQGGSLYDIMAQGLVLIRGRK